MKVRRIRYVALFQVEDDNPYRDKSKPPRKFWRDWIEVEVFEEANIRQLDRRHGYPGLCFQLRVPMEDPETGYDTDADGDRALLRVEMIGGSMDYIGGSPSFLGFISKAELEHERAYREGDLDGCIAAHEFDSEYVREEWQVIS